MTKYNKDALNKDLVTRGATPIGGGFLPYIMTFLRKLRRAFIAGGGDGGGTFLGPVIDVAFSPIEDTFETALLVTLSSATPGATIRYTIGVEDVTESSDLYTEPITISDTTIFKAKAWKDGHAPSNQSSKTYTKTA